MNLADTRDAIFRTVCRRMLLRDPQINALRLFHRSFSNLAKPLSETRDEELQSTFLNDNPSWTFHGTGVDFAFNIATGVGKSRLIAAYIAYLYLTGDSKHFVIVAPRAEIIRKFKTELIPGIKKYLFVDDDLITDTHVFGSENISSFIPNQTRAFAGPEVWVISPQALSVENSKLKSQSEHSSGSVWDHFVSKKDLVVFFDESHHLGNMSTSDSKWQEEVRGLESRLLIGSSASNEAQKDLNLIYSYGIKQCLDEGKYTKDVRVLVETKPPSVSDAEYDKLTLRTMLTLLARKTEVTAEYVTQHPNAPSVKPIALVCCKEQTHAKEIESWLLEQDGIATENVLLVISDLSKTDWLDQLITIENPDNPVKIVVNVGMLTEGWDVSNVFVIAPLRAMASPTLVTQVMGRGLRLPFGERLEFPFEDADTLDVMCFGKSSMQKVSDQIINQGFGPGNIRITDTSNGFIDRPDIPPQRFQFEIAEGKPNFLKIENLKKSEEPLDLKMVSIPTPRSDELHGFRLANPETILTLEGKPGFEYETFVELVTTKVLRTCGFLSEELHRPDLITLVGSTLVVSDKTDLVRLEPEKVNAHISTELKELRKSLTFRYELIGTSKIIDFSNLSIAVPGKWDGIPIPSSQVDEKVWKSQALKGIPISGWKRSAFSAVPFDTHTELAVAKLIDRSDKVDWWFRNLPKVITLATPIGNYSPDFAIVLHLDSKMVLLEIKGSIFLAAANSEANIKASAARQWCDAMSTATGSLWEYWLLEDADAKTLSSFDQVEGLSGFL